VTVLTAPPEADPEAAVSTGWAVFAVKAARSTELSKTTQSSGTARA
jgi:hypothetical protein